MQRRTEKTIWMEPKMRLKKTVTNEFDSDLIGFYGILDDGKYNDNADRVVEFNLPAKKITAKINDFCMPKELRGKGYGKKMWKMMENKLVEYNVHLVTGNLFGLDDIKIATGFWKKMGFKVNADSGKINKLLNKM